MAWPNPVGAITALDASSNAWGVPLAGRDSYTAGLAPGTNKRFYIEFVLNSPVIVYALGWFNGSTINAAGNIDASIYDEFGNLLVDSGATLQGTASTAQVVDVTDTVLAPGRYYLSYAVDNLTSTLKGYSWDPTLARVCGAQQQFSAFSAPNPATFATPTATFALAFVAAFIRSAF